MTKRNLLLYVIDFCDSLDHSLLSPLSSVCVYDFAMKDVIIFGIFSVFLIETSNCIGGANGVAYSSFRNNPITVLEPCTTPDYKPGECVKLDSCSSLRQIITNPNLSEDDRIFLRTSQCDYIDDYPWVCCEIDKVPVLKAENSICGKQYKNLESRITGGEETVIGEFPWYLIFVIRMFELLNNKIYFQDGSFSL